MRFSAQRGKGSGTGHRGRSGRVERVLIIGYDLDTQEWIVKNSWGSPGSGTLATTSLMAGTSITEMEPPDAPRDMEATWIGRWNMNHVGWAGQLVIRRTQDYRDGDYTKVGDYYVEGGRCATPWLSGPSPAGG
jgi:hypothetical protein